MPSVHAPNPRVVITGGPGAGKTTLIRALADRGFVTEAEAGRAIIRDSAREGDAPPWLDPLAFAVAMADRDRLAYARHGRSAHPVYFDRGLPDVLGYLQLLGLPVPVDLLIDAERLRYRDPVFFAPFWPDIYVQDGERHQDAQEARRTAEVMARVYRQLSYYLIELPRAPVDDRVAFIIEHTATKSYGDFT